MKIIAHRGHSHLFKGNSYEAIHASIENTTSFSMTEVDVQYNKDDVLVLYHDQYCKELNMMIRDMSTIQIMYCEILTLDDLFEMLWKEGVQIVIDIKGDDKTAELLVQYLKNKTHLHRFLYICSTNYNHLAKIIKSNMLIKLGYVIANTIHLSMYSPLLKSIDFVSIDFEIADIATLQHIRQLGKEIFIYTIHNDCEYRYIETKFINYIDGIITNVVL
jgi:glycerophosphoryl diester phosphodiesterase